MRVAARDMLPDDPPKPVMVNTGITVEARVLEKMEGIVRAEKVKSRNKLMGSFLAFAVEFFPHRKLLEAQLKEVEAAERCTPVEAIALLLRRGLAAYEKDRKTKK